MLLLCIKITDNGKAFVTNMSGALHTVARGVLVSGNGSTAGTPDHVDQAIGHYGADGKLRDTGIILNTKATGNLAFLGNMVGIYKALAIIGIFIKFFIHDMPI